MQLYIYTFMLFLAISYGVKPIFVSMFLLKVETLSIKKLIITCYSCVYKVNFLLLSGATNLKTNFGTCLLKLGFIKP